MVISEVWRRSGRVRQAGCAMTPDESVELARDLYAALAAPWVAQGVFFHFVVLPVANPSLLHAWYSSWPRQGFKPVAYRLVRRVDARIAWANPAT